MENLSRDPSASILVRSAPFPGLCYISGLTLYDEALIEGRWVGRYWTANGFIEPERNLKWVTQNSHTPDSIIGLDLHAFGLEMDGQSLHFGWELEGIHQGPPGKTGVCRSVAHLRSRLRPVMLSIHTEVDGTGFLRRWLEVKNTGDSPSALSAIWPWSGLLARVTNWRETLGQDAPVFIVGSMAERTWGTEGAFAWQPLPSTPLRLESRTGKSGHGTPFFIVRNEATGEHIVGGLEWSGNWAIELTCEQFGSSDALLGFRAGPVNPGPLRVVAPGETVTSPTMHLGMLFTDLDGAVQAWHAHLRKSVLCPQPEGRAGLVVYNHWSYHEHEMTEERLKFEVDVGAEIGAEVFVVDAGWFGNINTNWWTTVGDWTCGNRLPDGLEPVFSYARQKGLLCGLWMDAERLGSESQVAKEHPEWLLTRYGTPTGSGDLDLTNPDAQAWLEAQIVGLIERYGLDLFRLDYNTTPYEGGQTLRDGYMENSQWRHYEFVYSLYDRLKQRFPSLILENCAGGGGRTDLGLASRFHHTWITDWQILPRAIRILNGMTLALPPERVDRNSGVGQNAHVRGALDTQLRATLFSHCTLTGIYPSPGERNPEHVQRVRHAVDLYKHFIRTFLSTCRVYHHTPILAGREPRGWCVWEYVAADASRAVIGLFRLAGAAETGYHVSPRGLDRQKRYRITFDNEGTTIEKDGDTLRRDGLSVSIGHALGSELLLLQAV
ncbi:MAG: alpha-galactosidase [Candidatus Latescibacteria bacterium]|nr:alpha-galactosidase [Candidatus Latescibacterota bacterium]